MRPNPFDDDLQKLRTQIAFQEETIAMLKEYGQSTSTAEKDLKRLQEDLARSRQKIWLRTLWGLWQKDHSKAELLKKAEASIAPARKFVDQLNHALCEGTVELSAKFGEWDAKEDAVYIPSNPDHSGWGAPLTLKFSKSRVRQFR